MLQSERQGSQSEVYVRRYPDITGGICDFCGILNNLLPSEVQYMQKHVDGCLYAQAGGLGQLRCTYCPANADPVEVIKQRRLAVHDSPSMPGKLLAVCDSLTCSDKHIKRFQMN